MSEAKDRIDQINATLANLQGAWPLLAGLIGERIVQHTESLIAQNNDETRGRIKALRELLDLPAELDIERQALTAALSEQSDAAL